MGNDDAGKAALLDRFHQFIFRFRVQGAGGFIHNDNGRILGQHPGDFQPLALAAGKILAALGELPVESPVAGDDVVVDLGVVGSIDHFKILDGVVPHLDIVGDGILKEHDILVHHGDGAGEDAAVDGADGLSVKEDFPAPGLIQPGDEL